TGSFESCPSEDSVDGCEEIGICSEEDVLNITFKVCDTEGTGKVPASVIVQYLHDMTGQSTEHGRLHSLHNMLDPERRDISIDRQSFHSTMKRWIVKCSQDG
uniref:EF-hand domain-containing protein n=1 Tax=Callorhinchus milii TaxID=7868 RepID=A0A4W3JSD4_CALMI